MNYPIIYSMLVVYIYTSSLYLSTVPTAEINQSELNKHFAYSFTLINCDQDSITR